MTEFQTNKARFAEFKLADSLNKSIVDGEIKVRIDRFAFTANNITYAVLGERFKYWDFFPAAEGSSNNWGIIPVWGFADVIESRTAEVPVGDRLFGYFPPADELIMMPANVSKDKFIECSQHRSHLSVSYNSYRRVFAEPNYDQSFDNEWMLLFVLHLTSFVIYDMLKRNDWFGAKQIIITSASSKTGTGLAYGLANDDAAPNVIALTSKRNYNIVESMRVYDDVFSYDTLNQVDAGTSTLIVDMSANAKMLGRLHDHLGENLKFTSNVGMTHWNERQQAKSINLGRSDVFFAPIQIQKLIKELGHYEFERRSMHYIMHSIVKSRDWLKVQELSGLNELANVYSGVCEGELTADKGLVVVM